MKHSIVTIIILMILAGTGHSQPVNDLPCNAIKLPVQSICSYMQYTNIDATDSGVSSPQCSAYSGGDVWFKTVVPYSGMLTISIASEAIQQFPDNNGWMYRPGLAVYSGTCNSLVHDTCWIDDLPESPPKKPSIVLENLSSGDTIWLRIWEFSNNDNGLFEICVMDHSTALPNELNIPEGFSPNNDFTNETFEIEGIYNYPENEIFIYNVWGHEVFRMKQYDNSWSGVQEKGINKGSKLPTGTYFYILRLNDSNIIKGSLYLKRE